jgi:hypothetical protein
MDSNLFILSINYSNILFCTDLIDEKYRKTGVEQYHIS